MCLIKNDQPKKAMQFVNVVLLMFFALAIPARMYPNIHPDWIDGIRGMLLGVAIGCIALMGWKRRKTTMAS